MCVHVVCVCVCVCVCVNRIKGAYRREWLPHADTMIGPGIPSTPYLHTHIYAYDMVYMSVCGMLHGRLQRKSSTHIRDVGTLP